MGCDSPVYRGLASVVYHFSGIHNCVGCLASTSVAVGMVTVGTAHFTIMGIVFLVGFENYINKGAYWTGWLLCHIGEPL